MNQSYPPDLRSLADVDSPEVLTTAVRRFRRRLLSTGAAVLVAALALAGGIAWAVVGDRTLGERIDDAPGASVGAIYRSDNATTVLTSVARLDDGLGLTFLIAAPGSRPGDHYSVRTAGSRDFDAAGGRRAQEIHLLVPPPDDGRLEARLTVQHGCDPDPSGFCRAKPQPVDRFTIDLMELDVPEAVWSAEETE